MNNEIEDLYNQLSKDYDELQQELAKENNMSYQEEMARTWKIADDYKSRIEKAVEYIKENAWYMNKDDEEILDRVGIEGLLDILNGDNNE